MGITVAGPVTTTRRRAHLANRLAHSHRWEWTTLTTFRIKNLQRQDERNRNNILGKSNTDATNSSGFTGLPGVVSRQWGYSITLPAGGIGEFFDGTPGAAS
jgi:hypothetical protein